MTILSLKAKILITAILMICASFLFQFKILSPYITKSEVNDALNYQSAYSSQLAASFDFNLRQAVNELKASANLSMITSMDKKNHDHALTQLDRVTQFFNYHFILDPNGVFLSYPRRENMVGGSIPEYNMDWVKKCVQTKEPVFLDVVASQIGTLVSGVATPIFDKENKVVGVLRGVLVISDNNTILSSISHAKVGRNGYPYVVASNGLLIAHPEFSQPVQGQPAIYDYKDVEPVSKVIQGHSGTIEYEHEGETWLASYSPIPTSGWGVVVQQPKKGIVDHAMQKASIYLGSMTFFSLLILLVLIFIIQYALSPLLNVLDSIKSGTIKKETKFPKDEIGEIARQYNNIYSELISTNEQLKEEINQKIQTQDELIIAKGEAERANKSKSTFLANMSHEIRTPLNGIMGMTDLVLATPLTSQQKKYLTMVQSSSKRLLSVLSDILDFSRIDANKLKIDIAAFNLQDLLNEIIELFDVQAKEKNLTLKLTINKDIPEILHGDSNRLAQVLINLLSNAIKYTEKGSVELRAFLQAVDNNNRVVQFSIIDTGPGVAQEKQQAIFKSFTQLDEVQTKRFGGTGLGLAIALQLVKIMGGKLWIESPVKEHNLNGEVLAGSAFHCIIPFSETNSAHSTETDVNNLKNETHTSTRTFKKDFNVLVAEDDPINMTLICQLLSTYGMKRITSVENGLEAVEAYKKDNFDLILMDIQMPELDGCQATKEIRQIEKNSDKSAVIIALTALAMDKDRDKCFKSGMNGFLSKPLDRIALFDLLDDLL